MNTTDPQPEGTPQDDSRQTASKCEDPALVGCRGELKPEVEPGARDASREAAVRSGAGGVSHSIWKYRVDQTDYEHPLVVGQGVSGALIKSRLPEAKRGYSLFREQPRDHPDELVNDYNSVDTNTPGIFYTVPPCGGG